MDSESAITWVTRNTLVEQRATIVGEPNLNEIWQSGVIQEESVSVVWPNKNTNITPKILNEETVQQIQRDLKDSRANKEIDLRGFEPCAFYAPIHFNLNHWGIYIQEACLEKNALNLTKVLVKMGAHITPTLIKDIEESAFQLLYLHEEFHHRLEMFAIRGSHLDSQISYVNYYENVYKQSWYADPLKCREEAMCEAYVSRMLRSRLYKKIDRQVFYALLSYHKEFALNLRGPYEGALSLVANKNFDKALDIILNQIVSGVSITPPNSRNYLNVRLLMETASDLSDCTYILLKSSNPSISPGLMHLTLPTKKLRRYIKNQGFFPVGGSKHEKWSNDKGLMINLQGSRKEQHQDIIRSTAETLGISIPTLVAGVRDM